MNDQDASYEAGFEAGYAKRSALDPNVVAFDDETAAKLDQLAGLMHTDRAGYLRWVLTGKAPTTQKETTT